MSLPPPGAAWTTNSTGFEGAQAALTELAVAVRNTAARQPAAIQNKHVPMDLFFMAFTSLNNHFFKTPTMEGLVRCP
jgi:hypothetical protein